MTEFGLGATVEAGTSRSEALHLPMPRGCTCHDRIFNSRTAFTWHLSFLSHNLQCQSIRAYIIIPKNFLHLIYCSIIILCLWITCQCSYQEEIWRFFLLHQQLTFLWPKTGISLPWCLEPVAYCCHLAVTQDRSPSAGPGQFRLAMLQEPNIHATILLQLYLCKFIDYCSNEPYLCTVWDDAGQ